VPETMTLLQIIERLSEFDGEDTIYAAKPWTDGSKAILARMTLEGGPPAEALKAGLPYFLEIDIARDFVEDWIKYLGFDPGPSATCGRVIQYAINDA
jgi:hypothetical protein